MLKALKHGSEVELMREFATPCPCASFRKCSECRRNCMKHSSIGRGPSLVFRGSPDRTVEQARAAQDALIELTDFFRKTVAERRRNKGNDLINLLIGIEEDGERSRSADRRRIIRACIALLFAGHETTRNLIGNGMHTLLQHPQETAELREKPGTSVRLWRRFCVMRAPYDSPLARSRKISRFAASAYKRDGRSDICSARRTGILSNSRNRIS
jgi:cytochrome P450